MSDQQPAPAPCAPGERPPFNEISVLFPILTLCTVAYLAMITAEFFLQGSLRVPAQMLPVYIALLGAYAADKEIRRWVGVPEPSRHGSLFVYAWLLLFLVMIVIHFFRSELPLPDDLTRVVLQVLGIFFGSKASKYVHVKRQDAAASETEIELTRRQTLLMEHLRAKGTLTCSDAVALLGVSKSAAKRLLTRMQEQGLIRLEGEGRGAHYVAVHPVDARS